MSSRPVAMRTRVRAPAGADAPAEAVVRAWDPARAAVVVCDMWDTTHCVTAARRVDEMAPRMNEVLHELRAQGALIIHAPHGCMDLYEGTQARLRALRAPFVPVPSPIGWHTWEPDELAGLPATLTDPGPCSCESSEPCGDTRRHGMRQTPLLDIAPEDVVTDDGQEFYNVLEERGIVDVLVMGVHTNICVLSRPYGLRQLVYWRKRPVLCRDLTDAFHRDPRGLAWGRAQVIMHVERRWCPTVTSDQLVGGDSFRFASRS